MDYPLAFRLGPCQYVDMVCVYCGHKTKVTNSRHQKRNNHIWRRRKCLNCKSIFTTSEGVDISSALLVDKDGTLEPFLDDFLFTEILLALQDRKDAYRASREITNTVIQRLLILPEKPVFTPPTISKITGQTLKRFSGRAYLRYAVEHPSLS